MPQTGARTSLPVLQRNGEHIRSSKPSGAPLGANSKTRDTGSSSFTKPGFSIDRFNGTTVRQPQPLHTITLSLHRAQATVSDSENLNDGAKNEKELDAVPTAKPHELDDDVGNNTKRKPRPSLSERTIETLSQIPPLPSPSRRRPSVSNINSLGVSPHRSITYLRSPRSTADLSSRSISPSKQSSGRHGQTRSPFRERSSLSVSPNRKTYPMMNDKGAECKQVYQNIEQASSRLLQPRSSLLAPSSCDVPLKEKPEMSIKKQPMKGQIDSNKQIYCKTDKRVIQPRQHKLRATSEISDKSISRSRPSTSASRENKQLRVSARSTTSVDAPKSSKSLREAIANAKAARRQVPTEARSHSSTLGLANLDPEDLSSAYNEPNLSNPRAVCLRINAAVTSGSLNIAAMSLNKLPHDLLTMYDVDQDSKSSWFEAVDLVRFNAADNILEDLGDNFFPDWSASEMQEDEEKSNQFGGLQVLELRENRLQTLPVGLRRLGELRTLNLSNNRLPNSSLDIICQLPQLRDLYVANNCLSGTPSASLSTLSCLETLDMHANQLTTLSSGMADLTMLQKFDISYNSLTEVNVTMFQGMPLSDLNVSNNMLSGVFFPPTVTKSRLASLNVASNNLTALCTHSCEFPRLQILTCDSNQLILLPSMRCFPSIITLNASENKIQQLPDHFIIAETLRNIDLSNNHLKLLDPQLATMENLAILKLTGNPLRDRKYLTLGLEQLRLELAKKLETIPAEGCGSSGNHGAHAVSELIQKNVSTQSAYKSNDGILNLSSQNQKSLDVSELEITGPVHTIRVSNTDLQGLPTDLLQHELVRTSLRSLDLSHTNLLHAVNQSEYDLTLPSLKSLRIASTALTSLDGLLRRLSAPMLNEIDISGNRMRGSVPVLRRFYPLLTTLLASNNCFDSIEVDAIAGLEVVDIRNNDILYLPPKLGELGNVDSMKAAPGRLRAFECAGNKFRVPRPATIEKGTEAVLRELRRMIPVSEVGEEWTDDP